MGVAAAVINATTDYLNYYPHRLILSPMVWQPLRVRTAMTRMEVRVIFAYASPDLSTLFAKK